MTTVHDTHRSSEYEHVALLHDGSDELAVRIADPLRSALGRGEAVLVCLDTPAWQRVAARLGPVAGEVTVLPQGDRYATPGRAMAELHRFVDVATGAGAPAVWSVGSLPMDGSLDDARWWRYEAAVEVVLGDRPLHAICTYDRATVLASHIDAACRTHAWVDGPLGRRPSRTFRVGDPTAAAPAPDASPDFALSPGTVAEVRHVVADRCGPLLREGRLDDLLLIVSELVTNGVRHGDRPVTLRGWVRPDEVVVEVSDAGDGMADPYPDLRPPPGGAHGGFGLWLVGQLARGLTVGRSDDRTVVTAAVRR